MKILIILSFFISTIFTQTTITTEDIQYGIGGSYRMYDIPAPQGIAGLTGIIGGPYMFDFSEGPTTAELYIDYVDANESDYSADFPGATIAERKIDNGSDSYLFMDFEVGIGRTIHGFYDAVGVPDSPSVPFSPPLVDFPDNIEYLDYFTGNTNFSVVSSGVDLDVEYEYSGFVDAWGSLILPEGLGEYECLQINYEEQYTFYFMSAPVGYSYIRSYYYLAEDLGIAVILSSIEDENPVPNTFNIARTYARLFESSKAGFSGELGDINGDGVINILDVVIAVNIVVEAYNPSEYEFWAADINGDGAVNILDIVTIVNLILN